MSPARLLTPEENAAEMERVFGQTGLDKFFVAVDDLAMQQSLKGYLIVGMNRAGELQMTCGAADAGTVEFLSRLLEVLSHAIEADPSCDGSEPTGQTN